jgi:hypothetical protein
MANEWRAHVQTAHYRPARRQDRRSTANNRRCSPVNIHAKTYVVAPVAHGTRHVANQMSKPPNERGALSQAAVAFQHASKPWYEVTASYHQTAQTNKPQ